MEAKKIINSFYKEALEQTWKGKCIAGLEFAIAIVLALLVLVWAIVTYGSDNPVSLNTTQIRYLRITLITISLLCFFVGYANAKIGIFISGYKKLLTKQDIAKYKKLKKESLETLIRRNNSLCEKLKDTSNNLEREERLLEQCEVV